jgi:hypothetical protein
MALWCCWASMCYAGTDRVHVLKTPNDGIQPQAVVDSRGTLHLIYFKGDPAAGDLFYVRREAGKDIFFEPLRVNSQPRSAVAIGTIRGGQLALGKEGRVHVAWNGSGLALPKNPGAGQPMLYTRLNDQGTAFETQRNLMQVSMTLDGGGSVAADNAGHVYVAWHAAKMGLKGEDNRLVWVARSDDDGKTFAAEVQANDQRTGACGCCGMRAFADSRGTVFLFYRAAEQGVNRDMTLLTSTDHGKTFKGTVVDQWRVNTCPMSSESFAEGPDGMFTAWDTKGQVRFTRIDPKDLSVGAPVAAPGPKKERKHPALAANAKGEVLLAWTEDTGWERGGSLVWQVYDKNGEPTFERGRLAGGIPVWGLPTAVAEKDGSFTILH